MQIYINPFFLSCLVLCFRRNPTVSANRLKNAEDDETYKKPMVDLDWCQLRPLDGFTLVTKETKFNIKEKMNEAAYRLRTRHPLRTDLEQEKMKTAADALLPGERHAGDGHLLPWERHAGDGPHGVDLPDVVAQLNKIINLASVPLEERMNTPRYISSLHDGVEGWHRQASNDVDLPELVAQLNEFINLEQERQEYEKRILKRSRGYSQRFVVAKGGNDTGIGDGGDTKVGDGYYEEYGNPRMSKSPELERLTKFVGQFEGEWEKGSGSSLWEFARAYPWFKGLSTQWRVTQSQWFGTTHRPLMEFRQGIFTPLFKAYDPKPDWIDCQSKSNQSAGVIRFMWMPPTDSFRTWKAGEGYSWMPRSFGSWGAFLYQVRAENGKTGYIVFPRKGEYLPWKWWSVEAHRRRRDYRTPSPRIPETLEALVDASKLTAKEFFQLTKEFETEDEDFEARKKEHLDAATKIGGNLGVKT